MSTELPPSWGCSCWFVVPSSSMQEAAEELAFGSKLAQGAELVASLEKNQAAIAKVLVEPTERALSQIDSAHQQRIRPGNH